MTFLTAFGALNIIFLKNLNSIIAQQKSDLSSINSVMKSSTSYIYFCYFCRLFSQFASVDIYSTTGMISVYECLQFNMHYSKWHCCVRCICVVLYTRIAVILLIY